MEVELKKMHHRDAADTEIAAAKSIVPRVTGLRKKVLHELARHEEGATGEELAQILDSWLYSVKPRISELTRGKLVEDSGLRKKNSRNRQEIIWRITKKGRKFLL